MFCLRLEDAICHEVTMEVAHDYVSRNTKLFAPMVVVQEQKDNVATYAYMLYLYTNRLYLCMYNHVSESVRAVL